MKKKQTGRDHANFLMNSTNAQRSFIHEMCSQSLGNPPSMMWGHPIPSELIPPADKETLQFTMNAAKHAPHEFGRLISSHKKASGWISAAGDLIGSFGKSALKYGAKGGKWAIENGDAIKTGTSVISNLVQTGTAIAQISGAMSGDQKTKLDAIAAALAKFPQTVFKEKEKPKEPKKGGSFRRILI